MLNIRKSRAATQDNEKTGVENYGGYVKRNVSVKMLPTGTRPAALGGRAGGSMTGGRANQSMTGGRTGGHGRKGRREHDWRQGEPEHDGRSRDGVSTIIFAIFGEN